MSDLSESQRAEWSAARKSCVLFELPERGLLRVTGADRVRWLDGMLSNHIAALGPESGRTGCYATLLTHRGAIIADFNVMSEPDDIWLEVAREAAPRVALHLDKYIIADDVRVSDVSDGFSQMSLEGPGSAELLSVAIGALVDLGPQSCLRGEIGGAPVLVGAFGWSGEPAFRLIVPAGFDEPLREALVAAGLPREYAAGSRDVLEVLRIEAGTPLLGRELGEDVLPDEARLDRAISADKGCYVGQEIVARVRSRGAVNHLLVGFRLGDGPLPPDDADVNCEGRRTGEVTSSCVSPDLGPIALGYVRREHAEPGTGVEIGGCRASVAALPFMARGT